MILQVPVPEHAPVQPANTEFASGAAVSVTAVPVLKLAVHVLPQLIPAGELVTVPPPVPVSVTSIGNEVDVNDADTACAEFMVTEQAPVPEHAPLHPEKAEPAAGVAVSVTTVPAV